MHPLLTCESMLCVKFNQFLKKTDATLDNAFLVFEVLSDSSVLKHYRIGSSLFLPGTSAEESSKDQDVVPIAINTEQITPTSRLS